MVIPDKKVITGLVIAGLVLLLMCYYLSTKIESTFAILVLHISYIIVGFIAFRGAFRFAAHAAIKARMLMHLKH